MTGLNTFSRAVKGLVRLQNRVCRWMLLVLGIAMTVLILFQVFFRFVIYVPFPWSEECARYLMIWMGMLGSVIALEKQRHIGVTFLVEKLPRHLESTAFVLVQAGMALFLAVFCWQGIRFAGFNADQASPAMEISMLIPFSAIPAGCAMMILVIVDNLLSRAVLPKAGCDASTSVPAGSGRNQETSW
jgi:TRAP-type C4-dicarboxylate transport system permease small subunit